MRLNPDQLLSFVALAQTGSVSMAATARHLTQPAISNQLKRLQDSVGVPLYRRQGRGVVLTSTGEIFYRHALQVQHSLQQTELFADGLQGLTAGRVRLAASQTIAGSFLPAALVLFNQLYPEIEIFVDSANSQQVFDRMDTHDLGLVESLLPTAVPDCCSVELLGHDRIVAVMRPDHPLAAQPAIELSELAMYPLIWREAGSGTRDVLEQAMMTETSRRPEVHLCLGGVSAVLEAVRQGLGIGVVSQFCLPTGESILTTRPFAPQLVRPMSLLMPAHASPVAHIFADFIIPYVKKRLMDAKDE
ncbi:LysR family transcriptional regulator [Mariprofundus ferrooxydans]|uniref:LysR family transcriptional regulator n=1 Tax=Mariprofundus ferrooxydans TaxID=314344 RepID=UPI00142FD22A|nr:LysR substrate-binding domain-containing protein [Mariprofundus ferrooxydans]